MRLTRVLFCSLLTGSTLVHAGQTEPSSKSRQHTTFFQANMQLDLESKHEVGRRNLLPGETVRTGDRFGIKVWADQSVYLYVIKFSKDGWSECLFPKSGHQLVSAGEKINLPIRGGLYRLKDPPEENTLYLFASRKQIDEATCAKLRLNCAEDRVAVRTRGDNTERKEPPPPPPPAGKRARTREGKLILDTKERFVSVMSDEKGTAMLKFSFEQKPELPGSEWMERAHGEGSMSRAPQ